MVGMRALQADAEQDVKHFPRKGTGSSLSAICGRYDALDLGGLEDERRDRFTTDEGEILNPETGCAYCRDLLIEATAHPVPPPQAWAHQDIVARSIRGELDDDVRPWATWRAATRVYVGWQDSGASLRSSSDPGRFETLPSGYSGPPGGDAGQRQAERLSRIGEALAAAYAGGFVLTSHPVKQWLSQLECLQILVSIVCGRDEDQRTGGQGRWRKQTVRVRIPIMDERCTCASPSEALDLCADCGRYLRPRSVHAIVAAEVSRRTGLAVTAGHVGAIERQGGIEIQEALSRRGLVLHRDDRLDEAEAADMAKVLVGWKSIVAHLGEGWSEDRAQAARSWEPPIPVRLVGGRVEAEADQIDDWRRKGPVAKRETGT